MTFNPGDYTIEKLRYAKDFIIYPPVDANFKFKTLGDDDDPNFKPGDYHVIRGDFDNNPRALDAMNFRKHPLQTPRRIKQYQQDFSSPPFRDESYAKIKKMLKTANFKRK
jgi:hypothetical protein